MKENGIFERTHNAYQTLKDDGGLTRDHLNFAVGYLMGCDLPAVAAAVIVALERAYPDEPLAGHLLSIKEGH